MKTWSEHGWNRVGRDGRCSRLQEGFKLTVRDDPFASGARYLWQARLMATSHTTRDMVVAHGSAATEVGAKIAATKWARQQGGNVGSLEAMLNGRGVYWFRYEGEDAPRSSPSWVRHWSNDGKATTCGERIPQRGFAHVWDEPQAEACPHCLDALRMAEAAQPFVPGDVAIA